MGLATINNSIDYLRDEFLELNVGHFVHGHVGDEWNYGVLEPKAEKRLIELAEEIGRLQMTRSVMGAQAMLVQCAKADR